MKKATTTAKKDATPLLESPAPIPKKARSAFKVEQAQVSTPAVAPKMEETAKEKNLKPASWLVARLRNALHKSKPELKMAKTLQVVATLSDIRAALAMPREEWETLIERFFTLGGKL